MPISIARLRSLLLATALSVSVASTALAQTVANGPYYAMPSWDQTLPVTTRFVVLANFDSRAVLDRETGLVWERAPTQEQVVAFPPNGNLVAGYARSRCERLILGNRKGWRLPTVAEFDSLADPTQRNPALPPGHPFSLSPEAYYYTANIIVFNGETSRRTYDMTDATAYGASSNSSYEAWCVRGGSEGTPD